MKIIIPSLAMTPHGGGRVLVEIANSLTKRGHHVTIVTSKYPGSTPFALDERVVIKKIGPSTSNKVICLLAFLLLSPFHMAGRNIIANHFLTVFPSWFARIFRSHYIYLVQDIEYRFFTKPKHWLLRALCRWTYKKGNLVAANAYLASQLKNYNNLLLTLRLGISKSFFKKEASTAAKQYEVVYFLRSQPHKRLDRFKDILKKLSAQNIKVLCISQDIELLATFKGMTETIAPANDSELIDAIDSAKIMLLTSEHEGFALPPLECMARGLPAVMYECGGPSVYSQEGVNAFIIADHGDREASSSAIVDRIATLLESKELYYNMSENSRRIAAGFRLDNAVDEFVSYMEHYFDNKR